MTTGVARAEHVLIVPDRWQDNMWIDHPPGCPLHTDSDRLKGVMTVRYNCDVAVIVQAGVGVGEWFVHRDMPASRHRQQHALRLWPGRYVIECVTVVHDAGLRESGLQLATDTEWLTRKAAGWFVPPYDSPCEGVVASGDGVPAVYRDYDGHMRCRRCQWRLDEHDSGSPSRR